MKIVNKATGKRKRLINMLYGEVFCLNGKAYCRVGGLDGGTPVKTYHCLVIDLEDGALSHVPIETEIEVVSAELVISLDCQSGTS